MKVGIYNGGWYKARYIEFCTSKRTYRLGITGLPWNWQSDLCWGTVFHTYRFGGSFHIRVWLIAFGFIPREAGDDNNG